MNARMKKSEATAEVVAWLRNPEAVLVVLNIGREMLDAYVYWPSMPISTSPLDDTQDYTVSFRIVCELIKTGRIESDQPFPIFSRFFHQVSICRREWRLKPCVKE